MKYTIRELDAFSVIGQEAELTDSQKRNVQISTQFWRTFNSNLKISCFSQSGNWLKYAFMERRNGKLYYFCSIPKRDVLPVGFLNKEIPAHQYLVAEHIGPMDQIYRTYEKLYQEILPDTKYIAYQESFLHFEKYDARFHWNREDSVIEIWVPVKEQ